MQALADLNTDAAVAVFRACVESAGACAAYNKTAPGRRNALTDMLNTVRGVDAACIANASAVAACLRPGGALQAAVVSTFGVVDGYTASDRRLIDKLRAWVRNPRTRELRQRCNACERAPARVHGELDRCVGCRCACMGNLSSTGTMLLYRPRLEHCLCAIVAAAAARALTLAPRESLDKSRVLFLDYHAITKDLGAAARAIVDHAGLAPFDWSAVTADAANARFAKLYPTFTTSTGWSHALAPPEFSAAVVPAALEAELDAFLNDDVDALRRLTGLALDGW